MLERIVWVAENEEFEQIRNAWFLADQSGALHHEDVLLLPPQETEVRE